MQSRCISPLNLALVSPKEVHAVGIYRLPHILYVLVELPVITTVAAKGAMLSVKPNFVLPSHVYSAAGKGHISKITKIHFCVLEIKTASGTSQNISCIQGGMDIIKIVIALERDRNCISTCDILKWSPRVILPRVHMPHHAPGTKLLMVPDNSLCRFRASLKSLSSAQTSS